MIRSLRFVTVAVAAALLTSACGTSTTSPPRDEPVTEGGQFRMGLVQLSSQDPARANTVSERIAADILYDGLTTTNPVTGEAAPALAKTWTESPDNLQWTFVLDPSRKAANGQSVTAGDVKQSIEHLARPSTKSQYAEYLEPLDGFDAFKAGKAAGISGITALDDAMLRITLTRPFLELPLLLANPAFGIVHGSSTTGPFSLTTSSPNAWHLAKVDAMRAHVDTVDVHFYTTVGDAYQAFRRGEIDWTALAPQDVADAKLTGDVNLKASLRTLSLTMNVTNPALADVRFREAIERAVDRGAVAAKLDLGAKPLNGVVPQGVVGEQGGGCGATCFHDVERAKQLVRDVYPDGKVPSITIDVIDAPSFSQASLDQLVADLGQVGIPAIVRKTPLDKFGAVVVAKDRMVFETGWSAAYVSPGAFLDPLYRSDSPSNVSGLKRAQIDTALGNAFGANSNNARLRAYRDAETAVMSQLPVVPIAGFATASVSSDRMRGINVNSLGTFDVANVWARRPLS